MAKKAIVTVPKKDYDTAVRALRTGIALLEAMEEAGAIRLPFLGYPEALAHMKAATKR